MDSQKRKKIIIIAAIILALLVILFFVWRTLDVVNPTNDNLVNGQPVFQAPSVKADFDPSLQPVFSSDELTAVNLAKAYTERLGSYSTDQPGVNLKELASLSTKSMNQHLSSLVSNDKATSYSGVTTKSIAGKIDTWSADTATIIVQTQRIETKADLSQNVYYQDIKIDLIKAGDIWLVNAAWWQDKK